MRFFIQCLKEEWNYMTEKIGIMLILFVGMLFLGIWFTGAYYSDYVEDVPIAMLDKDRSTLSREILNYFDENERFHIQYEVDSQDELQSLMDQRKVYMGIYIPKDLNKKVQEGQEAKVLVLTDGTNVVIGNNVYAGAAQIIQSISVGASIKVLEAKGALTASQATSMALPLQFEERMLYDPKMSYMNYLMYGIIAVFFQQLMLSALATLLARNKEEVASDRTFRRIGAKITFAATMLLGTGAVTIFYLHHRYDLAFKGNVLGALALSILFAIAISGVSLLIFSLTKKKTRYTQIVYMLSLPTFLTCGYVWPVDQMPPLLKTLAGTLWPLMHYARAFDETLIKGLPFSMIGGQLLSLAIYSLVVIPLGIVCFKRSFADQTETHDEVNGLTKLEVQEELGL